MTPSPAPTTYRGSQRKAPSMIRNSPMNPFNPGMPIEASVMMKNAAVRRGMTFFNPPNAVIARV